MHTKNGISYKLHLQALRLKRIFSDNENFDKRCRDYEKWLMERDNNEKIILK